MSRMECPTCGGPVRVEGDKEGTAYYVADDAEVERLRAALGAARGALYEAAYALDVAGKTKSGAHAHRAERNAQRVLDPDPTGKQASR